jgi:multiple sugar transport system substrate-binding protein
VFAAGTAAALILAGCAPPGISEQRPAQADQGPIVVAGGRDVSASGVRRRLIDAWNTAHRDQPGMQAELVELPGSADQQRSQLAGALQSGSASYDVVNLDITWVPEFAQAGLIRPLGTDAVVSPGDVIGKVLDTGRWKDRMYAVPFNTDAGLLYYRPDYLSRMHLPVPAGAWTWNELESDITALDRARANSDPALPKAYQAAWVGQSGEYEGLTVNTMEAFWSVNGPKADLTDASGHYSANSAELAAALRRTALLSYPPSALQPAGNSDFDEQSSLDAFATGKTAFLRHWPYAYGELAATMGSAQFKVAPLPLGTSALGGQDLAVTADSPHAAAAERLIAYLTDPDSERCLLDAGFAATRTSSYRDNSRHCTKAPAPSAASTGAAAGANPAPAPTDSAGRPVYADQLLSALESARARPRTPYYAAVTSAIQRAVHSVLVSRPVDYQPAADDLDAKLKEALKGH